MSLGLGLGINKYKKVDSGFTPAKLNLAGWYSAENVLDELGDSISDGEVIGTIVDQGPNGWDLVKHPSASAALWEEGSINSLPSIDLSGTRAMWGDDVEVNNPFTICCVFKHNAIGGNKFVYDGITERVALRQGSNLDKPFAGTSLDAQGSDANWNIVTVLYQGTTSQFIKNGEIIVIGDMGSNNLSDLIIGANNNIENFFDGKIAEMVIINGAVSLQERIDLENFFSEKYNITVSTPPSNPSEVSSLIAWWDADTTNVLDTVGGAIVDGVEVGTVNDLSGNGHNLTKHPSIANRPIWRSTGIGGKPVFDFSGVSDRSLYISGSAFILNQPTTIAVVFKLTDTTGATYLYDGAVSNRRQAMFAIPTNWSYFAGSQRTSNKAEDLNETYALAIYNNAGSSSLRFNGVLASGADPGSSTLGGFTLGSRFGGDGGMKGYIAEAIIWDKALTDNEILGIEQYLTNKYGI